MVSRIMKELLGMLEAVKEQLRTKQYLIMKRNVELQISTIDKSLKDSRFEHWSKYN